MKTRVQDSLAQDSMTNDLYFHTRDFCVFFYVLCEVRKSFFEHVHISCQLCYLAFRAVQRIKDVRVRIVSH